MTESYRIPPSGMEARIMAADKGLKGCPFPSCDHHGGVVIDWDSYEDQHRPGETLYYYFVFCNSCNCSGPRVSSPEYAARTWNERDSSKQVDVGP